MNERRVFKYSVEWGDIAHVDMPEDAQILTAQLQGSSEKLVVWALVNPGAPLQSRTFRIAGTGHRITETVAYISTVQLFDGSAVFHVFEVTP